MDSGARGEEGTAVDELVDALAANKLDDRVVVVVVVGFAVAAVEAIDNREVLGGFIAEAGRGVSFVSSSLFFLRSLRAAEMKWNC